MNTNREMVEAFDTTLRDGMQVEGVSATVEDKLRIAEQLDYLGVHFIEGGWPGANPKDEEFFARAKRELKLKTSRLVDFGSTRRPAGKVDDDATLRNLINAETSAVCIVAKSWDYHVETALQTPQMFVEPERAPAVHRYHFIDAVAEDEAAVEHGHARLALHAFHQGLAAARHDQVDQARGGEHGGDARAIERLGRRAARRDGGERHEHAAGKREKGGNRTGHAGGGSRSL